MKKLLILSGKGGTGKTTTAAAFTAFAKARAVADCDVDAPNLHLVTGERRESQLSDFMGGDKAVLDSESCIACGLCYEKCRFGAIEKDPQGRFRSNEYSCEGCGVCQYVCPQGAIKLLPDLAGHKELYTGDAVFSTATLKMGRGNSGKLVADVKAAMIKNAPDTELAIIDGPPGIGCPVIASVSGVDLVLAVAEPSLSGMSDLRRLVKTAQSFRTRLAVCVNKWDVSPENSQAIQDFCQQEGIPFLGKVPYDKNASVAINSGRSLADCDCPARDALKKIYDSTRALLGLDQ